MKRIPARKYPIFAALIAVIAVSALIGSALFLPGNRNPDKSRLSATEISRTETDSDSADRHTADNSSQEKNENQISAPEKDSGQAEQQKAESPAPKQAPSAKASGQAAVRDSNHTDTQGKNKDAAAPRQQPSEPSGAQSDTSARYAYLTFDDGPSRNTDAILKILAENNIKATFFVTARNTDATNMQRYRRIVEAGHTLAMHSGTHNYREVYASREAFLADYAKISDLVYEITGTRSVIYRFPGGSSNTLACRKVPMKTLIHELHSRGVEYFDWNVNSADASGKNPDPSILVRNVSSGLKYRHNIILMHDAAGHETTVKALPSIIQACRDRGLIFSVITPQTPPAHHHTID